MNAARKKYDLPSLNVPAKYRSAVVTEARAKAKAHRPPTERQIRQLRFIWMRSDLRVADLPSLNWIDCGGLVCRRLLAIPAGDSAKLIVTGLGEAYVTGKIHHLRRKAS